MARSTRQRDAILAAFEQAGRPLSPQEILGRGRRRVTSLGMATVYRNIKRLVERELIVPVALPGEAPRYELSEAAVRHHHHFRCDRCASVFDVAGCPENLRALVPAGFELHDHEIVLYGICATCARKAG